MLKECRNVVPFGLVDFSTPTSTDKLARGDEWGQVQYFFAFCKVQTQRGKATQKIKPLLIRRVIRLKRCAVLQVAIRGISGRHWTLRMALLGVCSCLPFDGRVRLTGFNPVQ